MQKLTLALVLLLAALPFVTSAYAQLPVTEVDNPQRRIVRAVDYISRTFSAPAEVNDSTATYDRETRYTYTGNRLTRIAKYNADRKLLSADTITYTADNEVLVNGAYHSDDYVDLPHSYRYTRHMTDYRLLLANILNATATRLGQREFEVSDNRIRRVAEINSAGDTLIYNYFYSPENRLERIESENDTSTLKMVTTFATNHLPYSYSYSVASTPLWCCSWHYRFDDDGYLIRKDILSDTNASITIYQYENGEGNASFVDTATFDNILRGQPIIY